MQGLISFHHFSHNREANGQTLKSQGPFQKNHNKIYPLGSLNSMPSSREQEADRRENLQSFLHLINTNQMNNSINIVNHKILQIIFFFPSSGETRAGKRQRNYQLLHRNSVRSSIPFSEAVLSPYLSKFCWLDRTLLKNEQSVCRQCSSYNPLFNRKIRNCFCMILVASAEGSDY